MALPATSSAFALARGPATAMLAQALLGAGLAGTSMPGLKVLSDRIEGLRKSRAIAFYTSTFGIGNSLSPWMRRGDSARIDLALAGVVVGLTGASAIRRS